MLTSQQSWISYDVQQEPPEYYDVLRSWQVIPVGQSHPEARVSLGTMQECIEQLLTQSVCSEAQLQTTIQRAVDAFILSSREIRESRPVTRYMQVKAAIAPGRTRVYDVRITPTASDQYSVRVQQMSNARGVPDYDARMNMIEPSDMELDSVGQDGSDQPFSIGPGVHERRPGTLNASGEARNCKPVPFLDEAVIALRTRVKDDGLGEIPDDEVPDRPKSQTPAQWAERFAGQRAEMEANLKDKLEANAKRTGFCTHPMSVVRIIMLPGTKEEDVHTEQYAISVALYDPMTQVIGRWFGHHADRVGRPRMQGQRGDAQGTETKHERDNEGDSRMGGDFRDINKHMDGTDKFDLPRINDIFGRLVAYKIFRKWIWQRRTRRWRSMREIGSGQRSVGRIRHISFAGHRSDYATCHRCFNGA